MSTNILEMELRQQTMEKEMCHLKDTVWKLTGRIYVLEAFLNEKFDEVILDFGMKLCLASGGQANFLNNAMQASLVVSTKSQQQSGNSSMGNEKFENGRSAPPVGANITISHRSVDENDKNHHHGAPVTLTRLVTRGQPESSGSSRDGNRSTITNSRILCKPERSGDNYETSQQQQSDFNVEEFVVFPQVPEFVLGTELQNGAAENLMVGSESSESEDREEIVKRNIGGTTTHKRNRRYKCVPCSKFFTSEWHLKAHFVKHSDGILTTTVNQQQQGSTVVPVSVQGSVTDVIQMPTDEDQDEDSPGDGDSQLHKPFACVYCAKKFKKRQELTVHMRIHTGEKPYKCPVCERGFSQSSSMKTHLRIHTGEKKVKCEFCKSSFTVMHNYKKHLQTCHQIQDFP